MPLANPTRRDIFRLSGGALALTAMTGEASGHVAPAQIATGVVLDEATGAGIAGVLVSDGHRVVSTDSSGHYQLPLDGDGIVFIIKPSGWSIPVDPLTMTPRFYYIHQPAGTPVDADLGFAGIEPTGPLPQSINFSLRRTEEPSRFDVLMLADPQPSSVDEIAFIRETIVSALAGSQAAFGMTLGDVMSDDLGLYDHLSRVIGQIGVPWWNLPGNHDLNYVAPESGRQRETWKRHFGPPTYAFSYGPAQFIMLDNVEWRGMGASPAYRGAVSETQLGFVSEVLARTPKDQLIVLCMHIPLVSASDRGDPGSNVLDRSGLLSLLGDRPAVSFSGHMHTTEHHYLGSEDGLRADRPHHHHVLTAASGSWWSGPLDMRGIPVAQSIDGTPNGWHVLSIDGTSYSTRFVSAREPSQMRIMLQAPTLANAQPCSLFGGPVQQAALCNAGVLVNVFDAGPRTRVSCRIAGRDPLGMVLQPQADPSTRDLFERAGGTRKSWVQAETSSHIWSAALPADLPAGVHRLEVTAVNEYGHVHQSNLVFEVSGA